MFLLLLIIIIIIIINIIIMGELSTTTAPVAVCLRVRPRAGERGALILCYAMLCYARLDIILYYTILYYTILYYTILYYTILYYTLYYTILYYAILYYTILYYTIRPHSAVPLPRTLGGQHVRTFHGTIAIRTTKVTVPQEGIRKGGSKNMLLLIDLKVTYKWLFGDLTVGPPCSVPLLWDGGTSSSIQAASVRAAVSPRCADSHLVFLDTEGGQQI